jgi:hypothetical protein
MMPDVILSKSSMAHLSEKEAWRYYAGAKDDNWREALNKWVEARDAALLAWAEEFTARHQRP